MHLTLRVRQEALEEFWRQGVTGHELLKRYTGLVDAFIIDQFRNSPVVAGTRGALAMVALGGYGRGELYPYSDIDLLLLHDRRAGRRMQEVAESILYPLWDAGFEVGHSVRGIKDAIRFATEDFFFQVSLLDARFLSGERKLFDTLLARFRKKILDKHRRRFVRTMEEFRAQRRERYGAHAYLLEPHIKEGRGGMRDIQAMLWTAQVVFGLKGPDQLAESGILTADEFARFMDSWNMLIRVRNHLHYVARRKNDQLVFEYQEELAAAFGYEDTPELLAVERFMRDVYGHLQTVAATSDFFFEHVREVLEPDPSARRDRELEKGIVVRGASLHLVQGPELEEKPFLLMRLFLQVGRTGLPLHHLTRQLVNRSLHLVDDRFRHSRRVARAFFELLVDSPHVSLALETMLETGLLTAYLPELAAVESLAQHDLYHIYTVDRHQLQTVAELRRLWREEEELCMGLASPHLLYLAALLHDVGKGRGGDHSVLGAGMMGAIGERLGLDEAERKCLDFLVRYHLYLPENAMRRDLEDQEFIARAADLIGDQDRLAMLYLLTIADSRATGPSAWSDWKATLLAELFFKLRACLEAGCQLAAPEPVADSRGVAWLRRQVDEALAGEKDLKIAPADLPEDYLVAFTPEMVAHHLRLHRDNFSLLRQRALLRPEARQGYWSLLMFATDRPGLLAKLCGVLALHNLSVLAAQIFTWPDNTVVDVLDVKPVHQSAFEEQDWQGLEEDLNRALGYRLDVGFKLHQKRRQFGYGLKPARRIQQLEKRVVLDNDSSRRFTVIEVYGGDAPATLYQLAQTLSDFGLDIHRARIATEVEQLIDIFYVLTRDRNKVEDPALREEIRATLLRIVSADEQEPDTASV